MDIRQIDARVAAVDLSTGAQCRILLGLGKPHERTEVDLGRGRRPGVVATDGDGAGVLVEPACVGRFDLVAAARAAHPKAAFVRQVAQFPLALPDRAKLGIQEHDRRGLAHRHGIGAASLHFLPVLRLRPLQRLQRRLLRRLLRGPQRGSLGGGQRGRGRPRPGDEASGCQRNCDYTF
ncbi:hypothetical protein D3C87_1466860 [compost metagenome]